MPHSYRENTSSLLSLGEGQVLRLFTPSLSWRRTGLSHFISSLFWRGAGVRLFYNTLESWEIQKHF